MPSVDDLLDLRGVGQREASFEFHLLDDSLSDLGTIAVVSDNPPVITNDTTQMIQRTMSGFDLPPDLGGTFEEIHARIRPFMVLGGVAKPLGTFVFVDARRIRNSYGIAFEGTLGDLGVLINQQSIETYSLPVGALLEAAIAEILEQQGVTYYLIEATGVRLNSPIGWPAGTSWKVIIDALAALMACTPLYFEADGRARVRTTPNPGLDPIDATYDSGLNIFDDGIADWNTLLSTPNFFKVIDSGVTGSDIVGTYEVPDSAPNSRHNIGRLIADVSNQQGLTSASVANEVARLRAITYGTVIANLGFDGPPDWRHETYSTLSVLGDRYLERRWTLTCAEGAPMTHEASRVFV